MRISSTYEVMEKGKDGEVKVLLAAVSEVVLDGYLEAAALAGVEVGVIEPMAVEIAKAIVLKRRKGWEIPMGVKMKGGFNQERAVDLIDTVNSLLLAAEEELAAALTRPLWRGGTHKNVDLVFMGDKGSCSVSILVDEAKIGEVGTDEAAEELKKLGVDFEELYDRLYAGLGSLKAGDVVDVWKKRHEEVFGKEEEGKEKEEA